MWLSTRWMCQRTLCKLNCRSKYIWKQQKKTKQPKKEYFLRRLFHLRHHIENCSIVARSLVLVLANSSSFNHKMAINQTSHFLFILDSQTWKWFVVSLAFRKEKKGSVGINLKHKSNFVFVRGSIYIYIYRISAPPDTGLLLASHHSCVSGAPFWARWSSKRVPSNCNERNSIAMKSLKHTELQ